MAERLMAVTMGDASGVGPEILLRAFANGELEDDFVVYGDLSVLERGCTLLSIEVALNALDEPATAEPGALNVVDLACLQSADLTPGAINERSGAAALAYVERATRDALAGRVAGVTTMPMNKEATQLTTPGFVGHTEFIADLCACPNYAMMLTTPEVAVAHVSAHVSLREAIERVTTENVYRVIELVDRTLKSFLDHPRIAVCGLNPHAGENGLFGTEDAEHIKPAIEKAVAAGMAASGPFPADTVFYQAIKNDAHDAIICMYHDQGHAPMKLVGFESAVNVTIGLPIVRTSVDHGTAFDIAWQGKAFTSSLRSALDYAWRLAGGRRQ